MRPPDARWFRVPLAGVLGLVVLAGAAVARMPAGAQERSRSFTVVARRYAFTPATIEVRQGDLVTISLRAEDIPHSFTVDEYRIAKRAGAGETVTFEFQADKPGSFPFYCNLQRDEGCRQMRGTLVVRAN